MKCVTNGDEVRRVTDQQAHELVNPPPRVKPEQPEQPQWMYCSKAIWKAKRLGALLKFKFQEFGQELPPGKYTVSVESYNPTTGELTLKLVGG